MLPSEAFTQYAKHAFACIKDVVCVRKRPFGVTLQCLPVLEDPVCSAVEDFLAGYCRRESPVRIIYIFGDDIFGIDGAGAAEVDLVVDEYKFAVRKLVFLVAERSAWK